PTPKSAFLSGLTLGIALLTKFSTVLLLPFFLILLLVYDLIHRRFRFHVSRFMLVLISAFFLVVWPVYYFQTYNYPPARQYQDTQFLLSSFGNRTLAEPVVWMADKPVIRALGQYLLGLLMVVQRSAGGNTTYFLSEVSAAGWHSYFPIVYFIKEPLAWWGLVAIALASAMAKFSIFNFQFSKIGGWMRKHFAEFAMLLWLAIYWATSIRSNLNIGVRHLLPTYPFAILLVSGQIAKIAQSLKLKAQNNSLKFKILKLYAFCFTLFALLGWYVYESVSVYPYYLTYFNQVAGGPGGGYRYVVDSNLDWGQDLLRLSNWVKANNIPKIELDYFGWADPAYYLKDRYIWLNSTKYRDAADFVSRNQSGGWLAVSATFLQGSRGTPANPSYPNYDQWLKAYQPVTVIGNSIFVYQIR
ncbi:MAG: hypothetical protein HY454_04070, partial [Parcubacteria group bacterium]|nr:hypothetical protein [Parcubacteria group bacterium]